MNLYKSFFIFICGTVLYLSSFTYLAANSSNYTVCEGSGEKCRVTYNGVPVGFTKSKDGSAIVIKF
jgi:hypothetical protein